MMEHGVSKFSDFKRKSWVVFGLSYVCFIIWNAVTTGWLYGAKIRMEAIRYWLFYSRYWLIRFFILWYFSVITGIKCTGDILGTGLSGSHLDEFRKIPLGMGIYLALAESRQRIFRVPQGDSMVWYTGCYWWKLLDLTDQCFDLLYGENLASRKKKKRPY